MSNILRELYEKLCLLLTFVLSLSSFSYTKKTKCEHVLETSTSAIGALDTGCMGGILGACFSFAIAADSEVTRFALSIGDEIVFYPYKTHMML